MISIIIPTPKKTSALVKVLVWARSKNTNRIIHNTNPISATYLKYFSFRIMLNIKTKKHSTTQRSVRIECSNDQKRKTAVQTIKGKKIQEFFLLFILLAGTFKMDNAIGKSMFSKVHFK